MAEDQVNVTIYLHGGAVVGPVLMLNETARQMSAFAQESLREESASREFEAGTTRLLVRSDAIAVLQIVAAAPRYVPGTGRRRDGSAAPADRYSTDEAEEAVRVGE